MAICGALDDDHVDKLERIMTSRRLLANETLVQQNAPRRSVFSLTSGMLRLYTDLPDGRRQIAGFLLPGDFLGLADDETYAQSAESVVPSVLCAFGVRDMEKLFDSYPKLKDRLHLMTRAALRQARDNQMVLGRLAPVEKLASFLLILSKRLAAVDQPYGEPGRPLHLQMSRMDIADHLGLTIETVSRSFTKLRNQNLIRLPEAHLVEMTDRRALTSVAGIDVHL
jgi:CRP/FNR family transcriptional regulator